MAYSDEDLNAAVASGVLTPEAVTAFRAHIAEQRHVPQGGEENFRLINSFNDIFVAIGVVIMLVAAGAIGQAIAGEIAPTYSLWSTMAGAEPTDREWDDWQTVVQYNQSITMLLGGLLVAITSWPLAEFFTRKRRMALPSILLLLGFVGGVFATMMGAGGAIMGSLDEAVGGFIASAAGLVAAAAAWFHWRRFMVPITVAAGAGAIAVTIIAFVAALFETFTEIEGGDATLVMIFLGGLAVFALAMRWDISDRERVTRRSDVAFWLHLLAAPMLAHPIFYWIGIAEGSHAVGIGGAFAVLAIYVVFGLIALAIDRRALLVSALAYVLAALTFLFDRFGAVELNFALTALIIGSALLTLSAFWAPIRKAIIEKLPDNIQGKLPAAAAVA